MDIEQDPMYTDIDPYTATFYYDGPRPISRDFQLPPSKNHPKAVDTVLQQQANKICLVPGSNAGDIEYGGFESHYVAEPDSNRSGIKVLLPSTLAGDVKTTIRLMADAMDDSARIKLAEAVRSALGIGCMGNQGIEFHMPHSTVMNRIVGQTPVYGIDQEMITDGDEVIGVSAPTVNINPNILLDNTPLVLSERWVLGRDGIYFRVFQRNHGICFELIEDSRRLQLTEVDRITQQYCVVSGIYIPSISVISLISATKNLLDRGIHSDRTLRQLMNLYIDIAPTEI